MALDRRFLPFIRVFYLCLPDPGFFEARDINSREFSFLAKMSSWAVDNVTVADHNTEHTSGAEDKNEKETRMGAVGTASDISGHLRAECESTGPDVSNDTYNCFISVPFVGHYGCHH